MLPHPSDLPIEFVIEKCQLRSGSHIAKARLEVIVGGSEVIFEGASYGLDRDFCIQKAKSEIMERFYSHYEIAFKPRYRARSILSNKGYKNISAKNVVLGDGLDATGLSYGQFDLAINHGILEVVERHLLASVWYGQRKIAPTDEILSSDYVVKSFCLTDAQLPFSMAILIDDRNGVIFCGSAVRQTYSQAKEHSINEAFMLYESYISFKNQKIKPNVRTSSGHRLATLTRKVYKAQLEHLAFAIGETCVSEVWQEMEITEIIRRAGLIIDEFSYVVFYNDGKNFAIRVINEKAFSPKKIRNENVVTDPFY